jgi:hypothetical protein
MLMPLTVAGSLTLPAWSVQVPDADCPSPSALSTSSGLHDATPDVASDPLKRTVTDPAFQPAPFAIGEGVAVAAGGVASRRIVTDSVVVPPSLVAVQVNVWPAESDVIDTAPQPLLDVICDSGSDTAQLTDKSLVYQPSLPGTPLTDGVIVGGELSLIAVTRTIAGTLNS